MPHTRVAARAAWVLAPVVACSDMPQFDGFWLRTVFDAAGIRADVAMVDVSAVYRRACSPLLRLLPPLGDPGRSEAERRIRRMASEIIAIAENAERLRPRVHHRTLPDAKSLWRT